METQRRTLIAWVAYDEVQSIANVNNNQINAISSATNISVEITRPDLLRDYCQSYKR